MTFADITAEMVARGAEDNATRNGVWANLAYKEIVNARDWPFTETFVAGSANAGFVTIADFRKAGWVGDTSQTGTIPGLRLHRTTYDAIGRDGGEEVAVAGSPEFWWYRASDTSVRAYPFGGTLYVRYYKRATALTGVQEPIFLSDYHYLIVDRAMVEVLKDNQQYQEAGLALQLFERGLAKMAEEYGVDSVEHDYIDAGTPYDG